MAYGGRDPVRCFFRLHEWCRVSYTGMFDKVLDIHKCWLQDDISNKIRLCVKEYCLSHEGYPFFDLRNQEGFVRTLMIRTASTGDLMVVLVFFHEDVERREALLSHLAERFPEITSLMYVINGKCNDTITDQEVLVFKEKIISSRRWRGFNSR